MVALGAVEEVSELLNKTKGERAYNIMQATGVNEIQEYLNGQLTKEEMISKIITATRQFAKRQNTWCRSQIRACVATNTVKIKSVHML
jgi:tRNA dimethylallyltransferase